MEFGVFSSLAWSTPRPDASRWTLEQSALAEAQGYDSAWLAEAGAARYGVGPVVALHAAQLAARTHTLRIGGLVGLRPFFHPLRLAEEVAMLDIMSGGRVDWALALEAPADAPGVEERHGVFREQLEVMRRAWAGEPFAHEGEFFRFPALECVPSPQQRPHPPVFVAARAVDSVEWAGEHGYPLLSEAFVSADALQEHRVLHGASSLQAGRDAARFGSVVRFVHCAESVPEAREQAGPALLRAHASRQTTALDPELEAIGDDPQAILDFLFERCAIVGDASSCRDQIEALRERVAFEQLLAWHDFGELPLEESRASQRRFAERVLPALR